MANVLFVAVREDIERAETLADMFEMANVGVVSPFNEKTLNQCDAVILVWSRAASRSEAFLKAAERALQSGKALSACLRTSPASVLDSSAAFDLAKWNGAPDSGVLDDFFYAAYAKLMDARRAAEAESQAAAEAAADKDAEPNAANDNPEENNEVESGEGWDDGIVWSSDDDEIVRDNIRTHQLSPGWIAPLPDTPLPTFTAKRFPAPPPRRRSLFGSVLRVFAVFAMISAAGFAGSLARAPVQQAEVGGVAALVTQADAQSDAGAMEGMADVTPPVWLREPASAPEMADQG
jgi:hypothetical protein